MRIDKYLWCVRLFKTRAEASDGVKRGKVMVNAKSVKPAYEVKLGDTLSVRRPLLTLTVQVRDLPKSRVGAKLVALYVEDLTPRSEYDRLSAPRGLNGPTRDPGAGRPTKKERRELDALFTETPEWLLDDEDEVDTDAVDL